MTGLYLVISLIAFSLLYATQLYFSKSLLLKLTSITFMVFISSAVYFTFETYKGWPTSESIESKTRVYAVTISPPREGVHDGAIYFMGKETKVPTTLLGKIFRYEPLTPDAPRLYYVPYSLPNEKTFSKVKNALEENKQVYIYPPKKKKDQKLGDGKVKVGEQEDYTDSESNTKKGNNQKDGLVNYDAESIEIKTPQQFLPPKEGETQ